MFFVVSTKLTALLLLTKSGILSVPAGSPCLSFPAVARPLRSPALLPGAPQPLCTSPLVTRPSTLRSLMKLCLYLLLGNGDISSPSKISYSSG